LRNNPAAPSLERLRLELNETAIDREVPGVNTKGEKQLWSLANHLLQRKKTGIHPKIESVAREAFNRSEVVLPSFISASSSR